jgi:hypothetical protein
MIHTANLAAAKLREKPSGQHLLFKMGIAFEPTHPCIQEDT